MKTLIILIIIGIIVINSLFSKNIQQLLKRHRLYKIFLLFVPIFFIFQNFAYSYNIDLRILAKGSNINTCNGILEPNYSINFKNFNHNLKSSKITFKPNILKNYSIYNNSLIAIRDTKTNKIIKYIYIGPKIIKLIKNPINNNIYVLCRNYFGSVWEIDTKLDLIINKFDTVYSPNDMTIDKRNNLFIAGEQLQKINLNTGTSSFIYVDNICYIDKVTYKNKNLYLKVKNKNNTFSYLLYDINKNSINKINNFYTDSNSNKITIKAPYTLIKNLIIISSKNNDFLTVINPYKNIVGYVSLDAPVDNMFVSINNSNLYVFHKILNQISIINLDVYSNTYLCVIKKIIDKRLNIDNLEFSEYLNKIFISNGQRVIASIDKKRNIVFKNYQDIPFISQNQKTIISQKLNKVFLLKSGEVIVQEMPKSYNKIINNKKLIQNISDICLNKWHNYLCVSDFNNNKIYIYDSITLNRVNTISTGIGPKYILASKDKNELYVINTVESCLEIIDLDKNRIINKIPLDLGFSNYKRVKLYNKNLDQIINIDLPISYETKVLQL